MSEKPLTEPIGFNLATEQRLGPKQQKWEPKARPTRPEDLWSGVLTEAAPFHLNLTARLGEPQQQVAKKKVQVVIYKLKVRNRNQPDTGQEN